MIVQIFFYSSDFLLEEFGDVISDQRLLTPDGMSPSVIIDEAGIGQFWEVSMV
nr:hypothetical protein [Haladaptatus halobius]